MTEDTLTTGQRIRVEGIDAADPIDEEQRR